MFDQSPEVIVVQNGARHNYGLPKAFAQAGLLEAFYTDMCADRGLGRLSNLSLPGSLGAALARYKKRQLPEDVLKVTRTTDIVTAPTEALLLLRNTTEARRQMLSSLHQRQGSLMKRWGWESASHIVNSFGQGAQFVIDARKAGLTVITDMIIAPSTGTIEQQEATDFPDWGPRPAPIPGLEDHSARALFDAANLYVCPSPFVAEDLQASYSLTPDRIKLIPYGIDETWLNHQNTPIEGRVLFVGSAERRKGIHYLAFATQLLDEKKYSFDFRVAGSAHEAVKTHEFASKLNFLGRVSRDSIADEFSKADIFVLPSLAEGSATVIYEAMAVGLPIITTKSSGSYVEHGKTGLIVPARDPDALAQAIETLMEDREFRDRLAANAKLKAREFTWRNFADKWVNLVKENNLKGLA